MNDPFDFDNDGVVSDEEEEEGFLLLMDDDDEDEEQGGSSHLSGCLTVLTVIAAMVLFAAIIL